METRFSFTEEAQGEKIELGIAHDRLVDSHEKLEKELMSLKEIHGKLTKSRDQLLAQHSNKQVIPSSSNSIVISPRNTCAMTNIVGGEKTLNGVINSQRVNNGKEGLGFIAKIGRASCRERVCLYV